MILAILKLEFLKPCWDNSKHHVIDVLRHGSQIERLKRLHGSLFSHVHTSELYVWSSDHNHSHIVAVQKYQVYS